MVYAIGWPFFCVLFFVCAEGLGEVKKDCLYHCLGRAMVHGGGGGGEDIARGSISSDRVDPDERRGPQMLIAREAVRHGCDHQGSQCWVIR